MLPLATHTRIVHECIEFIAFPLHLVLAGMVALLGNVEYILRHALLRHLERKKPYKNKKNDR